MPDGEEGLQVDQVAILKAKSIRATMLVLQYFAQLGGQDNSNNGKKSQNHLMRLWKSIKVLP